MHSTTGPSGQTYHHNGDYSGDVKVTVPMRRPGKQYSWGTASDTVVEFDEQRQEVTVDIPFEDMKHLVLNHLRSELTSFLEQADDEALVHMLLRGSVGKER